MSRPEPPVAVGRRIPARSRWAGRSRVVLRRWPAVLYPAAFLAASLAVQAQPAARRTQDLLWASTNLDNLAHHPLRALFVSAFLTDGDLLVWTALAALGLAGLVAATGPWRALAVAGVAHLVATAAGEGSLAVRIARGVEPASQRAILDVGPSFVVVAVLIATVVCGAGPWWRLVAAASFAALAPSLFDGLRSWDVAALGHLTAVVVGFAAGAVFLFRARRRAARTRRRASPSGAVV
jgi:hypothetical protein